MIKLIKVIYPLTTMHILNCDTTILLWYEEEDTDVMSRTKLQKIII